MLNRLVPEEVAWRRGDEIYDLMAELAGIVVEEDGLSWSASRKTCFEWTYTLSRQRFTITATDKLS